jgi:hypothetical protein
MVYTDVMEINMDEVTRYLPEGWQAAARSTKALVRSRNIATAEQLLALLMTYLCGKGSFMNTSVQMQLAGFSITKNAAIWRMTHSSEWLRWLAEELSFKACSGIKKPEFLGDKKVILVDASDEMLRNRQQVSQQRKLWRLHYAFDLFNFCAKDMQLTKAVEGEKLTRYAVEKGEIYIGDRMYCTIKGIDHLAKSEAEFILRYKSKAFTLYDSAGKKLDLLEKIRDLGTHQSLSVDCYYKNGDEQFYPIRVVALKKDQKAIDDNARRMARKWSKKQEPEAQAETKELNEYIVLVTNLNYTDEQILELYRTRWQIEMLFSRLKRLFGYGNAPVQNEASAKAWFYGKLFLAALCETILKHEVFSPEAQKLIDAIDRTKHCNGT